MSQWMISFIAIGGSLCSAASYDASLVDHTMPTVVRAGETYTFRIEYTNTGTSNWSQWTRLATSDPRGSSSVFEASSWLNYDRLTRLDENQVTPGNVGTFTFDVVAPSTPGTYAQSLELVQDGVTWFGGTGDDVTWTVEVVASTEVARSELKGISAPAYYPGAGVQFTDQMANDLADLKVDMMRVEIIGEPDATKSIFYAAYDQIVDRAAAREIDVLGLIDYQSVAWSSTSEWSTQTFRDRYKARVQEIVTRYSARTNPIRHWEIWNEQDICVTGFCVRIEPAPYALLLIDAYDAIKAIDSSATVVLGGISPKGFEYTENYLEDLYATTAIQTYYTQNGHYPFDVVACHPYPETFTAPDPAMANELNTEIKAVMNANNDSDKKVWLTEMGFNSSQVTEAQQAAYLTDSFLMTDTLTDPANPSDAPYVERYFWFCYGDFGTIDLWGLKTSGLTREKPAYDNYLDLGPAYVTKPTVPITWPPAGVYQETASSTASLSLQPSSTDAIQGNVATKISGDFHSANTDPDDHEPAFTDGAGLGSATGLLMDFPGENTPAWSGFWILDSGNEVDLDEVRVFSGNVSKDGRVFQHYDLYVTSDPSPSASSTWTLLVEEVAPVPFGTSNSSGAVEACLTTVTDPSGGDLASDVTAMRLDFYAVSQASGVINDDWDLLNGDDRDLADAAFESSLIYEVDAFLAGSAVPVVYQETATAASSLSLQPSSTDALHNNVATKISGGFHSVNTNPNDHEPAFTDGASLGSLTGLLVDYPGENTPAWSGFWTLASGNAVGLDEIRVFSGNTGKDGRIFHHADVYVTSDPSPSAGSTWSLLIEEVTSAAFGTSNTGGTLEASLTAVTEAGGGSLATGVTALRLDFYAVSRANSVFADDWNASSGDDCDGVGAAFESPLIFEVDAFLTGSTPVLVTYQETASATSSLSIQPSSTDDLDSNVATKISGGFHSANTNPNDHEPAFTDGTGLGSLTGLLTDYPGENNAAWSGYWVLNSGSTVALDELRVFSGNTGKDGRVFHHYDAYVTSDPSPSAGSTWALLAEEVAPASFGTSNASSSIEACLTILTDANSRALASGVTALRLDFYAVSRTNGVFVDDWDASNGDDRDGVGAAFESPLIFEVDAIFDQ